MISDSLKNVRGHWILPSVSSFFGLPFFLLYWMRKLNLLARFLTISTYFRGFLLKVEIAFWKLFDMELWRRLITDVFDLGKLAEGTLDTDDDCIVAHVAEVSKLWSFFFLFCCRCNDFTILCFCNPSIFLIGSYTFMASIWCFSQIVYFSNFPLIFVKIAFNSYSSR